MKAITKDNDLIALSDADPHAPGILYLCAGDLHRLAIPILCLQVSKDEFAVVPGPKADKLNFHRQGLEPVVALPLSACRAWALTLPLSPHRWAYEVTRP